MTVPILDFAAARAARDTGQPVVAVNWRPAPPLTTPSNVEPRDGLAGGGARLDDLNSALGFSRGDRVLLPAEPTLDVEPYAAGQAGTLVRLFRCPRGGALRAHVQTPWGRISMPLADLRHIPARN